MPGPVFFYCRVRPSRSGDVVTLSFVTWRRLNGFLGASDGSGIEVGDGSATFAISIVTGPRRARLILGRVGSKLIAAEERQSVIVLGPTQSMKTTGFAIPAILEWEGPVLATSVKTDLLRDTIESRAGSGDRVGLRPDRFDGRRRRARGHPWPCCTDWHGAQRTAMWLAGATRTNGSGLSDADFWYAASAKLLARYLFAAASSGRIDGRRRALGEPPGGETRSGKRCRRPDVPEALDAAQAPGSESDVRRARSTRRPRRS